MMKKNLFIVFLSILFIVGCSSSRLNKQENNLDQILSNFHNHTSDKILVAAHRAMHTKYPENSLAAYLHSIESGIDMIETDIRSTKDGKLVLMHDNTVNRTTNGHGKVSDFTYEELNQLELINNDNDSKVHRVPLAEDALNLVRGKIMVDLDIKGVYVKDLVNLVHKTNTGSQVVFFDSEFPVLDSVKLIDPDLLIMPRAHSLEDVNFIIKRYHPEVIHIDPSFFTNEVVNTIKKGGARVWINALGESDAKAKGGSVDSAYLPLIEGGADIIQTDLPRTLVKFLDDKGFR